MVEIRSGQILVQFIVNSICFCVSGTLGLELSSTPGTAKVLTRFLLSNRKCLISKNNLSHYYLSFIIIILLFIYLCFVGLVATS